MIEVKKLELRNVTCHECFVLALPDKGVVLVTGPNGSGKSTLVEGVSVAAYGKSLRGKPLWTDTDGQIVLTTRDLRIDCRKNKLQFDDGEAVEPTPKFDTVTKAREALDPLVGSWDVWRRTCAFSSRDSSHFTEAGDADRKRFLESILNLDMLDMASVLVRQDVRRYEEKASKAEQRAELLEQKVEILSKALKEEQEELAKTPAPKTSSVSIAPLQKEKKRLEAEIKETEAPLEELQEELAKTTARSELAKATAVRVSQLGICPTCKQTIHASHKDALVREAEDFDHDTQAFVKDLRDQKSELGTKLKGLRLKLDKTAQKLAEASIENMRAQEQEATRKRIEERVAERRAEIEALLDEQDEVSAEVHELQHSLTMLGVVDKVLGTRGLRAHLLHNALTFVESTANYWLQRIAGNDLKLHLTPYAAKSDGGVKDQIGLEIEGAGGGNGYKGASGGERRRVDIALMLALSEVARVSAGVAPGTLFFDECFDALDTDGVGAVCDVLNDLSQDRAVVVISHNEDVVRGLRNVHEHVKLERHT